MATAADIQEAIARLEEIMNSPAARDGCFGNLLRRIKIRGVRGLDAHIEFKFPVTAIAGTNGSGKTTFLQVASAVYVGHDGRRAFNLGDWIRNGLAGDTPPVAPSAQITYSFMDETLSFEVPYQAERTRWKYPRRGTPRRKVEFVGITTFAPRVEKKDRVHHARGNLQILQSSEVDRQIRESISRILGTTYQGLSDHRVGVHGKWEDQVPQLQRGGASYSEPHMGAGEQKVVRLVQMIEQIPPKSLILLEEPELTLHPDAQQGLAWYLMAVARRKGHQILVATHSEHLFQTLPRQARVLLVKTSSGSEVLQDVSKLRAARELTNSMRDNAPLVLVEDDAARAFLLELFRQVDRDLLQQCGVVSVGSDAEVRRLSANFRNAGVRAVGVRDGDNGESGDPWLLALPGDAAPESVLLADANVARAEETLVHGAQEAYQRAAIVGHGYRGAERDKRILSQMAREMAMPDEDLAARLTQTWLLDHREEAAALARQIKHCFESSDRITG